MSRLARHAPGTMRTCPHCRAEILASASICPACEHHLRFDPEAGRREVETSTPLCIEGTISHPSVGEPWEYSVMVSVHNDRGEEIARQVVGVGALHAEERRTFRLAVEVAAPHGSALSPS